MQESSGKFESQFFKLLSEDLAEESSSVGGGALGPAAQGGKSFNPDGQIDSGDTYASKTAVKPTVLGGVQTRSGSVSKKNKDKKKRGIDGVFLTGEEGEEEGTHPGYEDTTWSDGNITVTMQEVEKEVSPATTIPVEDIAHLDIHSKNEKKKTPEQRESTFKRAMKSDLKYPIIITKNKGKYNMVLDGNHRLHKAIKNGVETIEAKVLDLSKVPDWLSVFG